LLTQYWKEGRTDGNVFHNSHKIKQFNWFCVFSGQIWGLASLLSNGYQG
jgi:hypothetical protein